MGDALPGLQSPSSNFLLIPASPSTPAQDPIDLSLIEARLESRAFYVTLEIFAADVARVFANAQVYNAADTFFHKIAIKLYDEFQDWLSSGIVYTS